MGSVFRSRSFRGFIAFLFAGVALVIGWIAVWLLYDAVTGNGSSAGNILRIAIGLPLLVLSPAAFIFGIIYWKSSQPESKPANI